MATPCIAPQVEELVAKKTTQSGPKPVSPKPHTRSPLAEIFEGHEEFLGWTPD